MLTQLSQVVGAALQGPQGRMPLGLEPITIGRASTNQVVLSDLSVSSRHAIIALKDQGYWITDTGSTNGTVLNQQRLTPHVPSQLHPGDRIRLGNSTYTYEVLDRPSRSPVSSPSSEHGNTSAGAYPPSSPVIERPRQDRVGQRFGNYRLSRLLGQGGFAEVYLGEHIFLDTQTAIKVLHTQLVGQDVEQFRQEARTIAHLEHPHIVRLLDFGIESSTPYLIMSYAPYGTMRQRYSKGTRLPLEQVVFYVKQIAQALQYAHEHKIIHRDIKPENMLFGPDDQVVLSDFGIALVTQSSRYQQPKDMAGTIAYMAPEQIEAHPRPASDQYSLGIVVYEWLTGERPFHGSFTEIAVKHQLVAPASLRQKVPSLSAEVEQVVMTALAKDPRARFGSMRAFATALEQASQAAPSRPIVVPSQETLPRETWRPSDEKRMASEASQASMPAPVVTPPSQPAVPTKPAALSSQAILPTEPATSPGLSGEPPVGVVPSSPHAGVPPITEEPLAGEPAKAAEEERATVPNQALLPTEPSAPPSSSVGPTVPASPPGHLAEPAVAATSSPSTPVLPPATIESKPSNVPQPFRRRLSRRTVIGGLAGLAGLATGGGFIFLWTVSPHPLYTYTGHTDEVYAVAWSPDGKRIASGSADRTVQVWNAADGTQVYKYTGHGYSKSLFVNAFDVAWSPDGKRIASASTDRTGVQVWNATDGSQVYKYTGHTNGVIDVAWSPDGKCIASASLDKTVQVWNAADGTQVYKYTGHTDRVIAVAWSPDGKHIASGSVDKTVQVWQVT